MGAVNFSLSQDLVSALKRALPSLDVFVETGTFKGDSVANVVDRFAEVHTVELSPEYHAQSSRRFKALPHVHVVLGDSPDFLRALVKRLGKRPALFFLDAHWCVAEGTAGRHSQCPLLAEIAALGRLNADSVVLIDDARFFLAPPPPPHDVPDWPSLEEVDRALRAASDRHELMVVNDVIAFYPPAAREAMRAHARAHGVDWLRAAQALAENTPLRADLEAKQEVIGSVHQELANRERRDTAIERQLREKEELIHSLHEAAGAAQARELELAQAMEAARERELRLSEQLQEHARGIAEREAALAAQAAQLSERDAIVAERDAVLAERDAIVAERDAVVAQRAALIDREAAQLAQLANRDALLAERDGALREKESLVRTLNQALEDANTLRKLESLGESAELHRTLVKGLEEKEAVIQELSKALEAYRRAHSVLLRLTHPVGRIVAATRPRLGMLYQYNPRPMHVPASYGKHAAPASPPRISIVTPSFRQGAFIERTIASVVDQQYPNLEYRVQDGGSDDGTVAILERWAPRLTGWESRPDSGQSEAINAGFARTGGDIMAWLNSDDILLPGALAYVADFFNRHPHVDVVYGHRILIDENDQEIGRWMMPSHDAGVLSWADYVPQETLFWRRSIWEKTGGRIDESYRFAMDWDLLVRFRDAGARFERLPRFIGGFRIHPHQKTSAAISKIGFEEMDRIRKRALGRVPSHKELRRALIPYLLRHVMTDLGWRVKNRLGIQT